jgi:hypothetical protein
MSSMNDSEPSSMKQKYQATLGASVRIHIKPFYQNQPGFMDFLTMHKAKGKLSDKMCSLILNYLENEQYMWIPDEQVDPAVLSLMNFDARVLAGMKPENRQMVLDKLDQIRRTVELHKTV